MWSLLVVLIQVRSQIILWLHCLLLSPYSILIQILNQNAPARLPCLLLWPLLTQFLLKLDPKYSSDCLASSLYTIFFIYVILFI